MVAFANRKSPSSVLGLSFDGAVVEGALLRKSGSTFQVLETFSLTLPANPLAGSAGDCAKALRQKLDSLKIKERRCVAALPSHALLTLQTTLPDLPEAELASLIGVEAERNFPVAPEELLWRESRGDFPNKERFAFLLAARRESLFNLEQTLRAAELQPLSFSPAILAARSPSECGEAAELTLAINPMTVDVLVTCGSGIALIRSLEGAIHPEGTESAVDAELVARELRITLGQLPEHLRARLRTARVLGPAAMASRFARDARARLERLGLSVEQAEFCPAPLRERLAADPAEINAAVCVAARFLAQEGADFEFLPPRVSAWQQFSRRVSSRKLAWAGATAASILLLAGGAFLVQNWRLRQLSHRWAGMEKPVRQLEETQQQIRRFRPWFDDSLRGLTILRKLTEAFPVEGVVSAKTVEIRDLSLVSCTGVAHDNQALFKMLDQLRGTKEISEVKMDQIRGKSPLQFNFNFRWTEGGANVD